MPTCQLLLDGDVSRLQLLCHELVLISFRPAGVEIGAQNDKRLRFRAQFPLDDRQVSLKIGDVSFESCRHRGIGGRGHLSHVQ